MAKIEQTICWTCAKAVIGCDWSREFKPIDGWTAKPTMLKGRENQKSFRVIECPEYKPDEPKKKKVV